MARPTVERRKVCDVDVTMNLPTDAAARRAGDKIGRLLQEVEALIADDEAADRKITGGWGALPGHPRRRARPHLGRLQRRPLHRRRELPAAVAPAAGGGKAGLRDDLPC